jgi:hypothetical protein
MMHKGRGKRIRVRGKNLQDAYVCMIVPNRYGKTSKENIRARKRANTTERFADLSDVDIDDDYDNDANGVFYPRACVVCACVY